MNNSIRRLAAAVLYLHVSVFAAVAAPRHVPREIYNPPVNSSHPRDFVRVGAKTFFLANAGEEIWVTDGTAAGTTKVASGTWSGAAEFKGSLYFVQAGALWRTDGTPAGTVQVTALPFSAGGLHSAGSLLYITGPAQLWVTNGEAGRTLRVRTFSRSFTGTPFGHEGKLFFTTTEGTGTNQVWVSDGTLWGTRAFTIDNACASESGCYHGVSMFKLAGKVLLSVDTRGDYYEPATGSLWQTDGTPAGTILVKAGLSHLLASSSSVAYFRAGNALWKSNGTTAGTVEVAPVPFGSQNIATLAGNTLYLHISSNYSKSQLWTSNGTAAGTTLVREGEPHPESAAATLTRYFTVARDALNDSRTLWLSSGATNVSLAVAGASLFSAGDYVLFTGYEASTGYELWRSDGTPAGTFLLKNVGAETQTGEIAGVVRDKAGTPISGVTVAVYSSPYNNGTWLQRDMEVKTGTDGTFRVDKLTAGSYYLIASSPQHVRQLYPNYDCAFCTIAANGQPVSVLAGFATVDVDFSLSAGGQFRGVVKGPDGLPSTQYADIKFVDSSGRTIATARSKPDGTYESSPGLPAGDYYASALPPSSSGLLGVIHGGGVCGRVYPFTCEPHEDGGTPIRATPGTQTALDFKLLRLPHISGRAVDPATGKPLRSIAMNFYDSKGGPVGHTYTDQEGEYSFPLPPGSYFVSAVGADRRYASQLWHNQTCASACDVLSGRPVEIAYGTDVNEIDFALISLASRIQLLVTDADSGLPVSTRVTLYRENGSVAAWPEHPYDPRTDAAGRLEFTNVPPGKYFLKTGRQLYDGISCTTCAVTSGKPIVIPQAATVTVELNVAYRRSQRISGRVTIAATGEPSSGVRVSWRTPNDGDVSTTYTNLDGTWELEEPEVPAHLVFSQHGYLTEAYNGLPLECDYCTAPAEATVFDPAAINADMTGVNAALKTGGLISGVVRDRAGKPIPYAHITASDANGNDVEHTSTNQNGQYSMYFGSFQADVYLVAAATDYLTQLYNGINCQPCSFPSGTSVAVGPGVARAGINFALDGKPSNEIRGTISDALTGKPLPGVTVAAWLTSETYMYRTGRTDSFGQYKITVSPGAYVIVATPEYDYLRLSRIYGGASCPSAGCDPTTGKTVNVVAGQIVTGIDVQLEKSHITSVSPAFGPLAGGTRVTISGKYLPTPLSVKFDGVAAKILSTTATAIQVETPPGILGYADIELFMSSYPHVTITRQDAFSYVTSASDGDLSGDRRSDVFWRNTSTGANDSWLMDTRGLPVTRAVASAANTWVFQTLADFNGDGIADIFWRNTSSGQNAVWYMNQNGSTPRSFYAPTQATSWKFVGSGEFDRDGKADLFWQNTSSYQTQVWFGGDGGTFRIASSNTVSAVWQAQAVGDLSGDARADVIWRNTSNGQVVVWNMNGATLVSSRPLGTVATAMRLVGARDTDADGLADLFWRNDTTGENALWLVNRSSVSIRPLASVTGYNAIGLGDFNGDGRADVLWRQSSSGLPVIWIMLGATRVSAITLPSRANDWTAYLAK
ncbi:MAG TPA: carboxypeptidase regulatory-like domain-containing protein [Thermoanaerobaculia bacterium]|jgi:ELWxxDGT repeat protein